MKPPNPPSGFSGNSRPISPYQPKPLANPAPTPNPPSEKSPQEVVDLRNSSAPEEASVTNADLPPFPVLSAHAVTIQQFSGTSENAEPLPVPGTDLQPYVPLPCDRVAMMAAAKTGNVALLKTLWQDGCDPDFPDSEDKTMLFLAGAGDHAEMVRYLFEMGARSLGGERSLKQLEPGSILRLAARYGSPEILVSVLKNEPPPLTAANGPFNLVRLMHCAIGAGNIENMDFLERKGVRWKSRSGKTYSRLQIAAGVGNVKILDRLLKDENNPIAAAESEDLLALALYSGNCSAARFLLNLGLIPKSGNTYVEATFLRADRWEKGLSTNHFGFALLGTASVPDKLELLQILWRPESMQDTGDNIPMLAAAIIGGQPPEIIRFLLDKGAATHPHPYFLHYAAEVRGCNPEIVRMLVPFCGEINKLNSLGVSALMLAATHDNLAVAEVLLELGASTHVPIDTNLVVADVFRDHHRRHDVSSNPTEIAAQYILDDARIWIDAHIASMAENSASNPDYSAWSDLFSATKFCTPIRRAMHSMFVGFDGVMHFISKESALPPSDQQKQVYVATLYASLGLPNFQANLAVYKNRRLSPACQARLEHIAQAQTNALSEAGTKVLDKICLPFFSRLVENCMRSITLDMTVSQQVCQQLTREAGLCGQLGNVIAASLQTAIYAAKKMPIHFFERHTTLEQVQQQQTEEFKRLLTAMLPQQIIEHLDSPAFIRQIRESSDNVPNPVAFHLYLNAQISMLKEVCLDLLKSSNEPEVKLGARVPDQYANYA